MNHTANAPFSEITEAPQRLAIEIPGVSLWWATLAQPAAAVAQWSAWLTAEEKQRVERMTQPPRRDRAIAVRALLRGLLARELAVSPASLRFQSEAQGRPRLAPPFADGAVRDFNISHSGDGLLVGILHNTGAPPWRRIGVDLESLRRSRDTGRLAQRVLSAREQCELAGWPREDQQRRFLRYWVLKEAFSKAVGAGISVGFEAIDFEIETATDSTMEAALIPRARTLPKPHHPDDWTLRFLPVGASFVAALALEAREPEVAASL